MQSFNEPIKLHNSCSYKLLFEKFEDRNKKRINQFTKRKTALSTNQKKKDTSVLINNFNQNKNEENKIEKDVINIFNLIINGQNNQINIEKKIIDNINLNFSIETSKPKNNLRNNINANNITHKNISPSLVKTKKNDLNNKISINNNIINSNSSLNTNNDINKEVNISNLDEEKENISNNMHKINENNNFDLKFLSSLNDPFIQLGNNLITKAKLEKNYFTESYSQALGCDGDLENNNKIYNKKKLDDIEIIKEEKETDTPLRKKNKEKNKFSNRLFSMRKKIKLLKEKRKSKSLTKELYLLNKNNNKNIEQNISSLPNRNKNNDNICRELFRKEKTKIQLSINKVSNFIPLNKKKNENKKTINIINNNLKKEIKSSFPQKVSEIKINIINEVNKNKSFMNRADKQFYSTNKTKKNSIQNSKFNYSKNYNNNIKEYINNSKNNKTKNSYFKRKKIKFICIRKKKDLKANSLENSDNENNSLNKSKKNITSIKNKAIKKKIINPFDYKNSKNIDSPIVKNYDDKRIQKIIPKNNSFSIIKNNISSQKKKKEKIQSIKLINTNNFDFNYYIENNNEISYKLSPKKFRNKINKTSIQSPFYNNNKIIRITKPKMDINKQINNKNSFKSNKINKKNISFFANEEEKNNQNDKKKYIYSESNKKNKSNRTLFINNYNYKNNEQQKKISSNFTNFKKDLVQSKNINLKKHKIFNNSVNNINIEKLKSNNSYYLYIDINSL